MQNLVIKETRVTPRVRFESNGNLLLEGVTLPEDASKFYSPLISFVERLTCDSIHLTIKLEYINTASAKQIFLIFRLLQEKSRNNNVKIKWSYAEGDEDIFDSGQHFASLVPELEFSFVEYADL